MLVVLINWLWLIRKTGRHIANRLRITTLSRVKSAYEYFLPTKDVMHELLLVVNLSKIVEGKDFLEMMSTGLVTELVQN